MVVSFAATHPFILSDLALNLQKAGIMVPEEVNRLSRIDEKAKITRKISDIDLSWALHLLHEMPPSNTGQNRAERLGIVTLALQNVTVWGRGQENRV